MIKCRLRSSHLLSILAALVFSVLACNFPAYKSFIERRVDSPGVAALELEIIAKTSDARAFGEGKDEGVNIAEPAKPDNDAVSGVGEVLTEGLVINVFEGIVTSFSKPPKICIANYFENPLPYDCSITYSAEKITPYQNTLSIPEAGSWIQLDVTGSYSAIGVQFWGDYRDGWAYVEIDDYPAWKGFTKFENCEFVDGIRDVTEDTCKGGFFYYIEIDGLQGTHHTLKVVNIGGGETTIGYFGLGKVKK